VAVLRPEHLVDAIVEELRELARTVRELTVQIVRRLLELRLHELGVCAGLLAIEHARADLDGVQHDPDRIVAVLLALTDEPDGAVVLDHEAVDRDPVAHHAHVCLPEWSCSFHVD
jgi:hypothetical protein